MSARDLFADLGLDLPTGDRVNVQCFSNRDAHAHGDRNPSCEVKTSSGRFKCHACGAWGDGFDAAVALGRSKREAMELLERHGLVDRSEERSNGHREIVETYSYVDERGVPLFEVVRFSPKDFRQRLPGGTWKLGQTRRVLYRLPKVLEAARAGDGVFVVEGERDVHALEAQGIVATCNPGGAGKWRDEYSEALRGADVVVVADRDKAGGKHALEVARSLEGTAASVDVVEPAVGSDVSDHLAAGKGIGQLVPVAPVGDTPPEQLARVQHPNPKTERDEAWVRCERLAREPRILERFATDLAAIGLVGEDVAAQLLYLAATSRLFDKPVSAAIKGPSAAGKSYLVERALAFFPEDAFYVMTGMSERALAYSEEPLSHRMLVIYEAAGMTGEFATYLLRSLLSEGRVRYETVEKTKDGVKARMIERPGPTGLIVTTTQIRLHPENETRLLSIPVTDTAEQTKKVMLALAGDDEGADVDVSEWLELQRWIAAGDCRVAVPYARRLAELIPPAAIRLRRDFGAVLGLIRAHALLHQANRERDAHDRVVAAVDDYAVVRDLVDELVSDGIGATVTPQTRETVGAVAELADDHEEGVPLTALERKLGLDRSVVSRRVRVARERGYLRNLEDRRGKPSRIVLGDPLPEDVQILPDPVALEGYCTLARASGGIKQNGTPDEIATPDQEAEVERLQAKFGEAA